MLLNQIAPHVVDGHGVEGDEFPGLVFLDYGLDATLSKRSRMPGPDEHHGIQPIPILDLLFACIMQDGIADFLVVVTPCLPALLVILSV